LVWLCHTVHNNSSNQTAQRHTVQLLPLPCCSLLILSPMQQLVDSCIDLILPILLLLPEVVAAAVEINPG
jgi:hypothetical protein